MQPILDNILLVATEGMLYATASDKETTMEAKIELESLEEEGRITIPAKRLLDILKEFPEQPLTFDINTETNEVKIIQKKVNSLCLVRVPRIILFNLHWVRIVMN